jgi:hypothetical protein
MDDVEKIFSSTGWAAVHSLDAEKGLLAVEERIGRRLPSAFRTFFSLERSSAVLAHFSNTDSPIPLNMLGTSLQRWRNYDPLKEAILPFMTENQNVCVWGVRLDAGDDPPVVVDVDSGTPPRWQVCAHSFTDWLRSQIDNFQVLKSSSNSLCKLVLWSTKAQCDWWIAPRSAEVTFAALDQIEEVAGIGSRIYAPREECEELLRLWRKSKRR